MRRRLWLFTSAVAVIAVLVAAVPLLVVAADRDHFMLALGLPLLAVAIAAAVALSGAVARRAARPVEELAEAAGRLGTGDPRPVGRRYGVTELDQVADGLDSASRRVTQLLTADRELTVGRQQLGDPAGGAVEALRDLVKLGDAVPAPDRAGVAGAEPPGRLGQFLYRPGRPPGHGPGQRHRRRDRGGQQRQAEREQVRIAHRHDGEQRHGGYKRRGHRDRRGGQPQPASHKGLSFAH